MSETYLLKMIPAVFYLSASTRSCEVAHLAEDLASMTLLPLTLPPVSSPAVLHYLCVSVCVCVCLCVCVRVLSRFSRVLLFVTWWTVTYQAPLSLGFSRQEYWSGLPCPPPGNLPNPRIKPDSCLLRWQAGSLPQMAKPHYPFTKHKARNLHGSISRF